MKRYYFELLDEQYNNLGACIPDGSHKATAVNRAKAWMRENNVSEVLLEVNSMKTGNLLEMIFITIK